MAAAGPGPSPSSTSSRIPNAQGPEQFDARWAEYIHRIKVHELLRVMEEEQKKLKALRQQTDLTDLLLGFGFHDDEHMTEEQQTRMLYMRTLEQEKKAAVELAQETRHISRDPDFVAKSAVRLFKTKVNISDEQFELILSLCRDRVEQKQLRDAFNEKKNRDKYLHNAGEERRMLYEFLNSVIFSRLMLVLIALSTVIIILLTIESVAVRYSYPLMLVDTLIICVFIIEAGCKITMYKEDYFRNLWNILDLIIIMTYFLEITVDLITKMLAMNAEINRSMVFKFFKSLRSLRLLRAIKFLPNLQVIVSTIFQSMLSLGSIAVLMALFIFLFAIIGRGFFNEDDPIHFGNLWRSILTLFQLLTLDDWFDILDASDTYWVMFFYLFFYIVLEAFVFLNLFVAVLVDNFQLALKDASIGEFMQRVDFAQSKKLGLDVAEDEDDVDDIVVDTDLAKGRVTRPKDSTANQAKDHEHGMDLDVDDYFPLDKDSTEGKLVSENLKLLNSIDFEHFIWVRRMKMLATIMEKATLNKQNTWNVHDDTPDLGAEDDRHTHFSKTYEEEKRNEADDI